MTAIKNRKTADTAVPTVPPISPTAVYQLVQSLKGRTVEFIVYLHRDCYGDIDGYDNCRMTEGEPQSYFISFVASNHQGLEQTTSDG